ncbi:MAG: photosynthetic reaction center cytochrome c subunit [Herpetosiphonaceae bacterium]|nr:photosynthetic reaction center cytochrome c subunit [Herpetosiphonaceae bacterium]
MSDSTLRVPGSTETAEEQYRGFLIIFAIISVILLVVSGALVAYVASNGRLFPPKQPSAPYTGYNVNPAVISKPGDGGYLKPETLAAANKYIQEHPQPQNAQVLKGMSTAQIYNYMVTQVAGGLKQNCTTCHNVNNFASDELGTKVLARQMMLMVADLNQNYVVTLPANAGGKMVTCATCHNGKINFNTYPAVQSPIPQSWVLPLDNLDALQVTGKKDPQLAQVQQNQYTMNHMNYALGVGCAFCHNARYFPSYEIPQKSYALTMLKMSQHINQNYKTIMNGKTPSCWMCHQQNYLPPGSVTQADQSAKPISVHP